MQTDTYQQNQRNDKAPIIESTVRKSKDGRFIIHTTAITHIKPVGYYKAILESDRFPPRDAPGNRPEKTEPS